MRLFCIKFGVNVCDLLKLIPAKIRASTMSDVREFSELKSNLGKIGKLLDNLTLATNFSVKSLLVSFP